MVIATRNRYATQLPLLLLPFVLNCTDTDQSEAGSSTKGTNATANNSNTTQDSEGEGEGEGAQDTDDNTDPPIIRSDWQLVTHTEFIDTPSRQPVTLLQLGTAAHNENFITRGDIEVVFSTDTHIKVEMRKTAIGETRARAEQLFERYQYWAWAVEHPLPPDQLLAADPQAEQRCETDHWRDACIISAYYDGDRQPDSLGVEFRVSLPKSWEHQLKIRTQDMIADPVNYPDRGDISVVGLRGLLELHGQSGRVDVERAADALEVVDCPTQDYLKCLNSNWEDIGGEECSCDQFAWINIHMDGAGQTRIALNHPGLLNQFFAENLQDGLDPDQSPYCEVTLECDALNDCDVDVYEDRLERWKLSLSANMPSDAQSGIGATYAVKTARCAEIDYVEGPDDFGQARTQIRGGISFCAGTLADCPDRSRSSPGGGSKN